MSKRKRKIGRNASVVVVGSVETLVEDSGGVPVNEPSEAASDNPTQSESHSVCPLTWLPLVIEEHEQIATWHCWYSECKTYRVIRVASKIGPDVHFAATRGERPFMVLRNEMNTLEKAIRAVEQDWEKHHPGQILESNAFSVLAEAEKNNLHSAKIDLPVAKKSDRVISTDSTPESKTRNQEGQKNVATATKTEKILHVGKSQAVALLQALDFKAIKESSPIEKIEALLNDLHKQGADGSDVDRIREEHDEEASMLEEVLKTLKAKGTVEVVPPEGEERPVDRNGTASDTEEEAEEQEAPSYDPEPTETVVLNVADLEFAKYNPSHRTDEKSSSMKSFAKQLKADGKIYEPILVRKSDGKTIMEGHRRATACKMNGWPKIEARLIDDEEDSPEAVYATINANRRKHNGTETLEVFLGNKEAVPTKVSKKMEEAAALIGKPMLRELARKGLSARTVNTAVKTCKFVDWMDEEGIPSKDQVSKVLKWMMSHDKLVGKVMRAITEKRPKQVKTTADTILAKIEANEPLDFEVK